MILAYEKKEGMLLIITKVGKTTHPFRERPASRQTETKSPFLFNFISAVKFC